MTFEQRDMTEEHGEKLLEEWAMIGAAVLCSQRIEFLLYGLISHLGEDHKDQDKKFRNLDPEKFLRGNISDLKVTLGQLVDAYGDKFLLSTEDLVEFIKQRNLIVHSFWRLTKSNIRDSERLENPGQFLKNFLAKCEHWEKVLRGLMATMKVAISKKAEDQVESQITGEEQRYMEYYEENAEKYLAQRKRTD